jgi:outer membrane protein insertion porin family
VAEATTAHAAPAPAPAPHPARPAQIEVVGVDGELKRVAQEALTSRPNFAYTLKVRGSRGRGQGGRRMVKALRRRPCPAAAPAPPPTAPAARAPPRAAQEVETDLRRVFATGWFSSCVPDAEDTRDGVKLIIKVGALWGHAWAGGVCVEG